MAVSVPSRPSLDPRRAAPVARRRVPLWLLAPSLLAALLYCYPSASTLQINPDALEYVDIARHVAAGQGYVLAIKGFHLGGFDVIHDGLDERPPLYTLLAAFILWLGLPTQALQVVNSLLAALAVGLVTALGAVLFDRRRALLAGLLAALCPPLLVNTPPPMSEALVLVLNLLALWLLVRRLDRPSERIFALAGLVIGLAYLTRPATAAVSVAMVLGVVLAVRQRRALVRPLFALALGVLVMAGPITLWSIATRGSLSYTGQSYLYAVRWSTDVRADSDLVPPPSAGEFISANRDYVLRAIAGTFERYFGLIFLEPKWLFLLLPPLAAAALALLRGRYPSAAWPVLLAAAANLVVYGLTWSAYQRRYQLLPLLLLLPFAVQGLFLLRLDRLRLPRLPSANLATAYVLAVGLFWGVSFVEQYRGTFRYGDEPVGVRSYHGTRWTGAVAWVEDDDLHRALDWVSRNTDPDDVLAGRFPHPFTFFTGRPSTLLPARLDPTELRRFLTEYRVAYVLLNNQEGYRRRYQDDLLELEPEGVTMVSLEDYRIFDTRALWGG